MNSWNKDVLIAENQLLIENQNIELNKLREENAQLKDELKKFLDIENEIGCPIDVFWKVYRKLSGHHCEDINLYMIENNKIIKINPTSIVSGTYSNYPQDIAFRYEEYDYQYNIYVDHYSYAKFKEYNIEWFLTEEQAKEKLNEEHTDKH